MKRLTKLLIEVINNKSRVKELLEEIIKEENINVKLIIKEFEDPFNSYTENNNIYIKESLLENIDFGDDLSKKGNIYWLIKNIYHELSHINQEYQANQGILSDASMFYITTNLINDYLDSEDYVKNYKYQEIEINANQTAWNSLLELLENNKFFQDIIKQIHQEITRLEFQELFLNRMTKENKIVSVWELLPDNLNKVIRLKPELLTKYSVLTIFYRNNGVPKSLIETLSEINLLDYYENTKLWLNRMLFLKVINQDLDELKNSSQTIQNRYLELFNKMVIDYNLNINKLKSLDTIENNFSVQEYQKYNSIINDKITEIKEK